MDYPAPAIFLYGQISSSGITTYELVDGKQRLSAIYDFIENRLAVDDASPLKSIRGQTRIRFYDYNFSVEYLPTNKEDIINEIFDRLNRNVARLTPQELRHARYNGFFINVAERLADWMAKDFENLFPRIVASSRRQMKDVEFVATLLLLLDEGPKGYSVETLDSAFSVRDEQWDKANFCEEEFRSIVEYLREAASMENALFAQTRFRNQADYYSLFGALSSLKQEGQLPNHMDSVSRLKKFLDIVESDQLREKNTEAQKYYDAARSASNDAGSRAERIRIAKDVLAGLWGS
jgi:hypothetical protein